MKLPIKKIYFDAIKDGSKDVEFRDAHITFVCEETGETLRKDILSSQIIQKKEVPEKYRQLFEDDFVLAMVLK